jgi:two-component system, NtrC family, response regulator AtoC
MTSPRRHVLLVEDEADLREFLASALEDDGFAVTQAGGGADATRALQAAPFDGLLVDLRLPDFDGMQVLDLAVEQYPGIAAIVMTGAGGVPEAVTAIKRGAVDFFVKPLRIGQVSHTLSSALERRCLGNGLGQSSLSPKRLSGFDALVGDGPAMRQLFARLKLVAPLNSTVLIQGATGTGKELVARAIHQNSQRVSQRFVAFSAAAIPEPLAEAELFGHARGAFTGAVANRIGRFELAHRGTLFIDEVGLMPLSLQAKLLRALQEREIERVGESRPTRFDARVIAASNTDLLKLVKAGTFREDLYYRLNVVRIELPTLAERREDIPLLARQFVERSCRNNSLPQKTLTEAALNRLLAYEWPGNVRQLENVVEHAVAMAGAEREIPAAVLPPEIVPADPASFVPPVAIPDGGIDFTSVVSQMERDLILRCLERTQGNKRQAARLLGLSRTTLIDKLNRLNLAAQPSIP